MSDARPIGLFDSGVGGLTVLREVVRRLPSESTIYLGDGARAPYGTRSDDEVVAFSSECIERLCGLGVKAVVVACNTASSVALAELRRQCAVPILGVVRPGATAAALATRSGRIGVIATQATVRSGAYARAISDENPAVDVLEHPTPSLVPLVEAGRLEGPDVEQVVRQSLEPVLQTPGTRDGIDTLLLGCTHYPLLADVIERIVGHDIAVIDSASATASALASLLEVVELSAPPTATATHVQLTTGDVSTFRSTAIRLFGSLFPTIEPFTLAGTAEPSQPALTAGGTR
jgi:glutamate racemase